MPYRRLLPLLAVLAAVAIPAAVLDAACIGNSCDDPEGAEADVPFCSLPAELRSEIAAGYREERSPDVLVVPSEPSVWGWAGTGIEGIDPAWPSATEPPSERVPIVFAGGAVTDARPLPMGTTLTSIAPTVLRALDTDWAFPGVHTGDPAPLQVGTRPRLVVVIALEGVGSDEIERRGSGSLRALLREGAATLDGDVGSLPLDPAATLTTIGTGATPDDHGITGTWLRNDDRGGLLARAWSGAAPVSVIATFADDLEEHGPFAGRARVGLVAGDRADLGLIGRDWYATGDRDDVVIVPTGGAADGVRRVLARGYGKDEVPDVLGVVVRDSIDGIDRQLRTITRSAEIAADGREFVVIAGTGSAMGPPRGTDPVPVATIVDAAADAIPGSAPAVEGTQPGGLFLDQDTLTAAGAGSGSVAQGVLGLHDAEGAPLIADAFGGFAVRFGRFC